MNKTCIIDVDNTLFSFSQPLHAALQFELLSKGVTVPPPSEWAQWNFYREFTDDKTFYSVVNFLHKSQEIFKPFDCAQELLSKLSEDYYIIIASHREMNSKKQLENWLNINNLKHDDIFLSFDKTVLFMNEGVGLVIDDNPDILMKAYRKDIKCYGIDYPWNHHINIGIKLFPDLKEMYEYLNDKL